MVQTYQSPVRVYKHPFELVMLAYELRFPTCPQIPIFVGSEKTYEYKSKDGAEEVIERKCQLNVDAPYLLKKIAGVDYVYFTQKNCLDRRLRQLKIQASNISFSSRIAITEYCNYYVHPENDLWTCFEQNASLDVKSFFGFESTVEKLAVKQYAANIQKGKEILEYFIETVIKDETPFSIFTPLTEAPDSPTDSAIDLSHPKLAEAASSVDEEEKTEIPSRSGTIVARRKGSTPADDSDLKLEADYIQRFLGQLTPLEESRLCELKYWLQNHHKGKVPNDAHLLRFLRAREFDLIKAREMVMASLLWRKQHNVDKILSTYQVPKAVVQFFPGCWHHHDKEGRPLYVLRLGQLDIKGLMRALSTDGIVKFVLSVCEQGLIKTAEATKLLGKPISTWTLLVDLDGLSMRHLWRPGVAALLRIIEIVEAHYPETMGLMLITRAPRVFPVLWTLIGPFIDENTRKKFMIHGGPNADTELKEFISEEFLPEFIGGKCFTMAPDGGYIPKKLYLPVDSQHNMPHEGQPNILDSIYSTAYIYKGLPHEVLVPVSTSGGVLTWDFDVVRGSCEFSLLRHPRLLPPECLHGPASPLGVVAAAINPHESCPVSFDRNLQLGVDLFVEQHPITCNEGDSMQGSHYCNRPGTYVLQWKQQDLAQQHQTFDFQLPGHKCKLVYYQELLDGENFKGSMASLESCRSSFSSLSVAAHSSGGGHSKNPSTSSTPSSLKKHCTQSTPRVLQ